jgi:hypothetical protein
MDARQSWRDAAVPEKIFGKVKIVMRSRIEADLLAVAHGLQTN